jgi:cyclomaltodextrin glucanotransferase
MTSRLSSVVRSWRLRATACLTIALGFVAGNSIAQNASNGFWQAQSIYQIVTDRFFDGNAANNNADGNYNPANSGSVHGGDFQGVEQKLDYIKALGATAIWISPVVLNGHGQFHGYAGRDFYSVDPHWGTLSNLQHMIQAAHARGLLVIDDVICNHGDDLIYSTDSGWDAFLGPPAGYNLRYRPGLQYAAPFNTNAANPSLTNLFHNNGRIPDYNTAQHYQLGELSGLDDFRTESAYVRSNMVEIYKYWIGQAGFDGFRVDTTRQVEIGFWQYWCPAIHTYAASLGKSNFFMFGEVFDGSDSLCGSYTGTKSGGAFAQDSVLDYPLFFRVSSVFATASGNTKQIEDRYNGIPANYDPSAQMRLVTFLDNHDNARFLNASGSTVARLNVALAFLYTSRGIPCLYYGTEQAFNGGTDPNDREDMFDGQFEQGPSLGDNFNMTHPQFQMVARLNNFRRLYPALQTGTHVNQWNNPSGPGLFAYARRLNTQEVFVVFNTTNSSQVLPSRPTIHSAGTTLVNLFDTNETAMVIAGSQTPPITVPGTTAKIFIAQSQWLPLDPVVTSNSPAHDSTSVSALTPLAVQFSQPMDTNSVMAAFSTIPPTIGDFAWSPAGDSFTYTPAPSWPGLTTMTVRIADTAQAATTNKKLYAAFEARFRTAAATDLIAPTVAIQSPANGSSVGGLLAISGTAADNLSVQKVEIRFDNGAWLQANGTTTWNYSLNTSNFLNGSRTISARATDTGGNLSLTNSVSVRFLNVPGAYLQRISGGNPASVTDCSANLWLADRAYTNGSFGYSGGSAGNVANTVIGICTAAQSLYQRERYGNSSYLFDCPIGIYETTLPEAETFWSGAGQRVFNVFIQGQQVLTNFDIYVAAGGQNLPLSLVFTTAVTNSQLQVSFASVVDNARVSGVQARKIADVYSDNDGIPDWWRLAYFNHPTGQAGDNSRGPDDADADGVSNQNEFQAGTDPLNPASVFKITQVKIVGNDVQLCASTVVNRTYQLQRRDSLALSSWANAGPPTNGTGGVVVFTDNSGATNETHYYRVQAY